MPNKDDYFIYRLPNEGAKAKLASFIARGVFRIASSEMVIIVGNAA
jgi:hypothetical protein